ncbi:ROK family transcriptional regulator [Paraburkholderia sp. BL10I2N1]|uniref:ROK family transcriptional regulator n=1 Tax=Paraburkholderia sp. BL10I2N1 TaxID=1938796 RepID=UPI00105BFC83|nr:ROK family transcriptional regulator [Paraburkholderia sp. BL10I2N1]TDN63164.1 putative NBD/HSP70 family sugar kinase [Paraburkholderia sp. BL10I2N1]
MGGVLSTSAVGRQLHGQVVMDYIVRHGPISRAQVAKLSGLSKQTVSELVSMLEDRGWVREVGSVQGKLGRTAVTYELNPEAGYVGVADMGGTRLKLGIADVSGVLIEETRVPLKEGGARAAEQLSLGLGELLEKRGIERGKLLQVVVGVPGVVDRKTGTVHHSPNLPALPGDLEATLRGVLGVPVLLENEVNLAAVGELSQGCGQNHESFIFVAVGTGIGMGVILDGRLWRGARGAAGEIGYMPVVSEDLGPEIKQHGALETVASGQAILRLYSETGGSPVEGVPEIFERAASGDAGAQKVIDKVAQGCATAIAATATVIDPELCILGGGIGGRPELLERVRYWLAQLMDCPVPIEACLLGKRAGLLGALAVALDEVNGRHFSPQLPKGVQEAEVYVNRASAS